MTLTAQSRPFIWESADFTWEDPYAAKSWDTASIDRYALTLTEPLLLTSRKPCKVRVSHSDRLTLDEIARRALTVCHSSASPLTDALDCHTKYRYTASASLSLQGKSHRTAHLVERAVLPLTARTARQFALRPRATLTLTSAHRTHSRYRRSLGETAPLIDRATHHPIHTDRTALPIDSALLAPYCGTLSDITFTTEPLSDALWDRIATSPSGYGAFHPFEVGEYTYRNALIRLLLTTGAAGAQPLLYDVAFHVDIEDIREHGLADCTADAPTHIILERTYHHPPRIALTAANATADTLAIPYLVSQSTEDGKQTFDCELRTTDGTRVNGTVSYLAEGY